MQLWQSVTLVSAVILALAQHAQAGSIIGYAYDEDSAGLYEMEITQCKSGESTNAVWARVNVANGYYELKDLAPGRYSLALGDLFYYRPRLFSFVPVREGEVTPGDFQVHTAYFVRVQARDDGPACREIRQTFVSTGDVVKVTVWIRGEAALYCSVHDAHTHRQIGPARDKELLAGDTFIWRHGQVPTVKGQLYYVKLWSKDDKEFSLYVSDKVGGRAYPLGQAYYDGTPTPDVDIRCVIECDDDGLVTMCQRQRTDGRGHGSTHFGQTFKAIGPYINVVTVFTTAIEGRYAATRISIHEGGPEGRQIGPAKTCHLWNYRPMGQVYSVTWQPGEVAVTPGKTYYLKATSASPGVYAFTSKHDEYPDGRCYFDGSPGNPNEDLCFTVLGEAELYSSLGSIKGLVTDENGKPIAGATVRLIPWAYAADTDHTGKYAVSKVTAGKYAVECSAPGYAPRIFTVTLQPKDDRQMDCVLLDRGSSAHSQTARYRTSSSPSPKR